MCILSFIFTLTLFSNACDPPECDNRCGSCNGVVERVIDGDTIVLTSGETIRYIGVDTPEITRGHDDCYGQEAFEYNKMRVENNTVTIEYDASCTDRFDRLLSYVYYTDERGDKKMINLELLEKGYGQLLIIDPSNRYEEHMKAAEDYAKENCLGGWSACGWSDDC